MKQKQQKPKKERKEEINKQPNKQIKQNIYTGNENRKKSRTLARLSEN